MLFDVARWRIELAHTQGYNIPCYSMLKALQPMLCYAMLRWGCAYRQVISNINRS